MNFKHADEEWRRKQLGLFDRKSLPPNPFHQGSQNWRIYEHIEKNGWVKNIEILGGFGGPPIMNTTGRASAIRQYLEKHGFMFPSREVGNGVYLYEVIEAVEVAA
jgi:hypothetical protein